VTDLVRGDLRRMGRTLETVTWPAMTRWWNAQGGRTKIAVAVAAIFALSSLLNLAAAGFGKATANRGAAPVAATAQAPAAIPNLLAESAPADAGKTWSVTKVWQGTGGKETEDFVVGEHWRVDWLFSPAQAGGILQVFIYSSDGRLLMTMAANTQKGGPDSSFWSGRGTYFLRVNSSGGDWKLAVQDLR